MKSSGWSLLVISGCKPSHPRHSLVRCLAPGRVSAEVLPLQGNGNRVAVACSSVAVPGTGQGVGRIRAGPLKPL